MHNNKNLEILNVCFKLLFYRCLLQTELYLPPNHVEALPPKVTIFGCFFFFLEDLNNLILRLFKYLEVGL